MGLSCLTLSLCTQAWHKSCPVPVDLRNSYDFMPVSPEMTMSDRLPAKRGAVRRLHERMSPSLREHCLLACIIGLHGIVAYWIANWHGLAGAIRVSLYGEGMILMLLAAGVAFVVAWLLRIILLIRPSRPLSYALEEAGRFRWRQRLLAGFPSMVLLAMLISIYSSWKVMIPQLNAFSWDAPFHAWDVALHAGQAPWQWLQPLLGTPWVTSAINAVYHIWLFVIYFAFIWQAFSLGRPVLRTQFMLCFILLWALLGNVLATLLSSAGPCFYGLVVGHPDPYAPLVQYLHAASTQVPVWALDVQVMLWSDYQTGALAVGRGISAMPSLHVATSALVFLLAWHHGRLARWCSGIFLLFILIGSVHLAWHYAIDGYLSLVLTLVLWKLCGHVASWLHADTCRLGIGRPHQALS